MTLRILNLEDNPNDTELTLAELEKEWAGVHLDRVDTRSTFESALEKNLYDLILADYSLPEYDGLAALAYAKEKYPDLPFIFLTGAMGEESAVETLKNGGTDFVLKNRIFRLNPAIKRALTEVEELKIRRQTEEELKKSEIRYKKLVESLTDYIFTVKIRNRQPEQTVHGPGCEGITGYTTTDYENNPNLWYDMIYKDDQNAVQEQLKSVFIGKASALELEHRIIHKNGSLIWVKNVIVPKYNENGELVSYDGLISDISLRKSSEEKLKQEMDITNQLLMINEATNQVTDIRQLLKKVLTCANEIIKGRQYLSFVYSKDTLSFRPVESVGVSRDLIARFNIAPLHENTEYIRDCLIRNKPVILNPTDIPRNGELAFSYLGIFKSMVIIPLSRRQEHIGLIIAIFDQEKEFSPKELKILDYIAQHTSLALDQARLYHDSIERSIELSGRIETIQVMNEIDSSILSTLDSMEILESITYLVSRLIPCDSSAVMMIDREKDGFVYIAGFGISFMQKGTVVPFSETNASDMISTGNIDYVANLADSLNRLPMEEQLFTEGYRSHIRVPLFIKGEMAAILNIGSKRPSAFTTENLATLEKLSSQISVALQNARLLEDLKELFIGIVKSLSSAIDAKSPWTAGHSAHVTFYALQIGKELGFSEAELKNLELGALLHDIGKLGVSEFILNKPGKLSEEEYKLIKEHPVIGVEILSPIKQLKNILEAIRHHHEFYNGKGYPDGLAGKAIPLLARILCIADSVDAMTSDRPYQKGRPKDEIIKELELQSGQQFDPEIVRVFLQVYNPHRAES